MFLSAFQLFPTFKIARVDVLPPYNNDPSSAIVVLSSMKEVERMIQYVNFQNPGGHDMKAVQNPVEDWCKFIFS